MSLISRMKKQTCVYWPLANSDSGGLAYDDHGQPAYGDAVEKSCRWQDVCEEFVSVDGTKQVSKSKVFVDGCVVGGVLMLGELTDITDATYPLNNSGAHEIQRYDSIPNLKNTETLYVAYL